MKESILTEPEHIMDLEFDPDNSKFIHRIKLLLITQICLENPTLIHTFAPSKKSDRFSGENRFLDYYNLKINPYT